jgi:hypothetical protein
MLRQSSDITEGRRRKKAAPRWVSRVAATMARKPHQNKGEIYLCNFPKTTGMPRLVTFPRSVRLSKFLKWNDFKNLLIVVERYVAVLIDVIEHSQLKLSIFSAPQPKWQK